MTPDQLKLDAELFITHADAIRGMRGIDILRTRLALYRAARVYLELARAGGYIGKVEYPRPMGAR